MIHERERGQRPALGQEGPVLQCNRGGTDMSREERATQGCGQSDDDQKDSGAILGHKNSIP